MCLHSACRHLLWLVWSSDWKAFVQGCRIERLPAYVSKFQRVDVHEFTGADCSGEANRPRNPECAFWWVGFIVIQHPAFRLRFFFYPQHFIHPCAKFSLQDYSSSHLLPSWVIILALQVGGSWRARKLCQKINCFHIPIFKLARTRGLNSRVSQVPPKLSHTLKDHLISRLLTSVNTAQ